MRYEVKAWILAGLCLVGASLGAQESSRLQRLPVRGEDRGGEEMRASDAGGGSAVYEVRRLREKVYAEPRFTARPLAFVRRGQRMTVLDVKKIGRRTWLGVQLDGPQMGWIQRITWRRAAGEAARELEDSVALSGPALTLKSLRERLERYLAAMADREENVEEAVEAIEGAYLEEKEIEAFRRAGNLRRESEADA